MHSGIIKLLSMTLLATLYNFDLKTVTLSHNNYTYQLDQFGKEKQLEINATIDKELVNGQNKLFLVIQKKRQKINVIIQPGQQHKKNNYNLTKEHSMIILSKDYIKNLQKDQKDQKGQNNYQIKLRIIKIGKIIKNGKSDNFNLKLMYAQQNDVDVNKQYTIFTDPYTKKIELAMNYNGENYQNVEKFRIQINALRTGQKYQMNAQMSENYSQYQLNNIFQKIVGGLLYDKKFKICKTGQCSYQLKIELQDVYQVIFQTQLMEIPEVLSLSNEQVYDRVFIKDDIIEYILPFDNKMVNKDLSINVISISQNSQCFVNIGNKPERLEDYALQTKSLQNQRLIIKWSQLQPLQKDKGSLYIIIKPAIPGEVMLRLQVQKGGHKGILNPGIAEQQKIQPQELHNYIYQVNVLQKQNVTINLNLSILSGNANLFLKQCPDNNNCAIEKQNLNDPSILKVINDQNDKKLSTTQMCDPQENKKHQQFCTFAVAIEGDFDLESFYEVLAHEQHNHTLLLPGHSFDMLIEANEQKHFKFSTPIDNYDNKLFLHITTLWGSFQLFISKNNQYPDDNDYQYKKQFQINQNVMQSDTFTTRLQKRTFNDYTVQGHYYITVLAQQQSKLQIRFSESTRSQIQVTSLKMNIQLQSQIRPKKVNNYSIVIGEEQKQQKSIRVNINPLKGHYNIYASTDGKIPDPLDPPLSTNEHFLDINVSEMNEHNNQVLVAVQLSDDEDWKKDDYQYTISYTYQNKPNYISPGIIQQYYIQQKNLFYFDIGENVKKIKIIKTVVDSYSIELCISFQANNKFMVDAPCFKQIDNQKTSIEITEDEIKNNCQNFDLNNRFCAILLKINGTSGYKYALGYNFNDSPFQIPKNVTLTGPFPDTNGSIKFIHSVEQNKNINIYFNSKSHNYECLTKLVSIRNDEQLEEEQFPNNQNYDIGNQHKRGYINNIFYEIGDVGQKVKNYILLTIQPIIDQVQERPNEQTYFILQIFNEYTELVRTQSYSAEVQEHQWNYYTIYNNGNSKIIDVYASSATNTNIELVIAKGLNQRPPFQGTVISDKQELNSVTLRMTAEQLSEKGLSNDLKGYFTIGIRASQTSNISLYWNNKSDLNYTEITPNEPTILQLHKNKLIYFSFYPEQLQGDIKKEINVAFKSNVKADIFMLSSQGELTAPSELNYYWKGHIESNGGITIIRIKSEDMRYCSKCLHIGVVQTDTDGILSVLSSTKNSDVPSTIVPGFVFPQFLQSFDFQLYVIKATLNQLINIQISTIQGKVTFYVSNQPKREELMQTQAFIYGQKADNLHGVISINSDQLPPAEDNQYYILADNNGMDPATFTIQVESQFGNYQLERGISKYAILQSQQSIKYHYVHNPKEPDFNIQIEVKQIFDEYLHEHLNFLLENFVSLYFLDDNEKKSKIVPDYFQINENKIIIAVEGKKRKNAKQYVLKLKNQLQSQISFIVSLFTPEYKVLSLNETVYDDISFNSIQNYEGFNQNKQNLNLKLNICKGAVDFEIFSSDSTSSTVKKITNGSASVDTPLDQQIILEGDKYIIKMKNSDKEQVLYNIRFETIGTEDNFYQFTIKHQNGGSVDIELENSIVKFDPVIIESGILSNHYYKFFYTIFISEDKGLVTYVQACGSFMIDQAQKSSELKTFQLVQKLSDYDSIMKQRKVNIKIDKIASNTKYYGTCFVKVQMFQNGGGYVSPVWETQLSYDSFTFTTHKVKLPFNFIIFFCVILCIVVICAFVLKSWFFDTLSEKNQFKILRSHENPDKIFPGINLLNLLSDSYYPSNFYTQNKSVYDNDSSINQNCELSNI